MVENICCKYEKSVQQVENLPQNRVWVGKCLGRLRENLNVRQPLSECHTAIEQTKKKTRSCWLGLCFWCSLTLKEIPSDPSGGAVALLCRALESPAGDQGAAWTFPQPPAACSAEQNKPLRCLLPLISHSRCPFSPFFSFPLLFFPPSSPVQDAGKEKSVSGIADKWDPEGRY